MKFLTKSLLSAGAAAAALVSVSAPAAARDHRGGDGISAGEVIAGAVILGGLAAVLSSGNDRDRSYDRGYDRGRDYDYGRGGHSGYGRSDVTEIRNIDRTRYGYRVTGKLVVQDGWRGNNRGYGYRDRDRYNDYDRGYGYNRGYDKGRFTCYVERGRVIDVDYSGLDQWR
jgi:hypothetical protein